MPLLQATACGVPTLSLDWGPGGEFTRRYATLVCSPLPEAVDCVARCPYYRGQQWGYPSFYHFRRLIRWWMENQDACRETAAESAQRVAEDCNLPTVGQAYLAELEKMDG